MIRLNRNHGEFDYDVLANVFDVPCLMDWGFSPNELELDYSDVETEETITKTKALKTCPKCGHEF
jgi:hypothetical protein